MSIHLFAHTTSIAPSPPTGVVVSDMPANPADLATAVAGVLREPSVEVVAFWDLAVGPIPWAALVEFREGLDDAWHAGPRMSGRDEPDLLRFVQPLWVYRPSPAPDLVGAISWKLDLRATFVRASALRQVGSFDPRYDTIDGAALELGFRLMRHGAVCRQRPALAAMPQQRSLEIPLSDRYRLVRRYYGRKWATYACARRLMQRNAPLRELRAWTNSARGHDPIAPIPVGALHRDVAAVELPARPSVSVVLPTFGRYRYLAEVLDDLRAQTIAPTQILVADGNAPMEREPAVYDRYADLPIEVVWHEETGICSGRNACLQRATGDYVWFVDDDSRFAADNLESHLRVLAAYGADVSVGPAYTRSRPDLHGEQREIACTHMDCGTTLCRRSILQAVGGFDMQFNQYLAGEDGELGIRFVQAAGLMLNNPLAKRFHYLAPVGGSRTSKRSVHRFTRWSLLPRPVQSIYYTARRYFEPSAVADAMFQASLLAGWRRREGVEATRRWRLKTLLGELLAIPVTVVRLRRSIQMGLVMFVEGPRIPPLKRAGGDDRAGSGASTSGVA